MSYYIIVLFYLFSISAYSRMQTVEFSKVPTPLMTSTSSTLGKMGQDLTRTITNILKKMPNISKELADDFGQLEAMYYISFNKNSDPQGCFLYKIHPSQEVIISPKIILISSDTINSPLKGLIVSSLNNKTYFFKSKTHLIRVNLKKGLKAIVSYYQIDKTSAPLNYSLESIAKKNNTNGYKKFINNKSIHKSKDEIMKLFKSNNLSQNEVSLLNKSGKIGVYNDNEINDTNIQIKLTGRDEKSLNYIAHTHTKLYNSDYKTQLSLGMTNNTGIKISTGSRTLDTGQVYENKEHKNTTSVLDPRENQEKLIRDDRNKDDFFSAELVHNFNNDDAISLMFEEATTQHNDSRERVGAKYRSIFPSKNIEIITVIQSEIKTPKNYDKYISGPGASGWIQVKWTF